MNKFNLMGPGSQSGIIPFGENEFYRAYTKNTGNMLFYYACERLVDLDPKRYGWGGAANEINTFSKGLVLPLSNQIGKHFNLGLSGPRISGLAIPIVALGLGAQEIFSESNFQLIPSESIDWLRLLADSTRTVNIAVRGANTYSYMERIGIATSVKILGCPSLLINPAKKLGMNIKERYDTELKSGTFSRFISVAAGDPYNKDVLVVQFERNLLSIVDSYDATYVVQNPDILIKLTTKWYGSLSQPEYQLLAKKFFINYSNHEVDLWFRRHALTFFSVPSWIYYYSNRSLVIGTRIHGIQAAIQAGTPAICFCIDARTKELCEIMKLPHALASDFASGLNLEDCRRILDEWDANAFDLNRQRLALETKRFLVENGVSYKTDTILSYVDV